MSISQFVAICQCGCGQPVNLAPDARPGIKRLQPYRFIQRHQAPPAPAEVLNVLRGDSPSARQARQTHCLKGHEFTPENTIWHGPAKRKRRCRECTNARNRVQGKAS